MNFYKPSVADILRCHQRDQAFVSDFESQLHSFLKYLNTRTYIRIRGAIPAIANIWYYYMTSLGNIQTLGEEYTGTIRLTNSNVVPSRLQQLVWLILYVGGEPLLGRLLNTAESNVQSSPSLTEHAKEALVKCIQCFRDNKFIFKKIHQSLFYINGKYYNISNRLSGIKYVLLRDWLKNDSFSGSFKVLGQLSLFYILFNIVQTSLSNDFKSASIESKAPSESTKFCILCAYNLKNPTATLCGHIFCWDCIYDSLNYQNMCPVCREELSINRIILLQNYA